MMSQLKIIRHEIQEYLSQLPVRVSVIADIGRTINPGEPFTIRVEIQNLDAENEGIALRNMHCFLRMDKPGLARFVAPSKYPAIDVESRPIPVDSEISSLVLKLDAVKIGDLAVGETRVLELKGKALGHGKGDEAGGEVEVKVQVMAQVDLKYLFPSMKTTEIPHKFEIID